jgi:hypothetical protein
MKKSLEYSFKITSHTIALTTPQCKLHFDFSSNTNFATVDDREAKNCEIPEQHQIQKHFSSRSNNIFHPKHYGKLRSLPSRKVNTKRSPDYDSDISNSHIITSRHKLQIRCSAGREQKIEWEDTHRESYLSWAAKKSSSQPDHRKRSYYFRFK